MRFVLACFCLLITLGQAEGQTALQPADADRYALNPGDVLRISVWREDELLREARIQPDGTISFPLVGRVPAAGKSTADVESEIEAGLQSYIPEAVVTVELLESQGYRVFVIGEVNRPGEYQLSQPITVVQALSIAGGFTPFAGTSDIRIVRRGDADQQTSFVFDYDDVEDGTLTANVTLRSGDTVMVPASLF